MEQNGLSHMMGLNRPMFANRPRLIFAYADSAWAVRCVRLLRRNGWEAHMTSSGPESLRLAHQWAPVVVIVEDELNDGGEWMHELRLHQERTGGRLIIGSSADAHDSETAIVEQLVQRAWAFA